MEAVERLVSSRRKMHKQAQTNADAADAADAAGAANVADVATAADAANTADTANAVAVYNGCMCNLHM